MVVKSFTYPGFESEAGNGFQPGFEPAAKTPQSATPIVEIPLEALEQHVKPTVSVEEMEMAKNLAKEEGIREGYEKARREYETKLQSEESVFNAKSQELLVKIEEKIAALNTKAQESKQRTSDKISQIALSIARKVCGDVSDRIMEVEISKILGESISKLDADERIKIYASAKNAEYLNNKFTGMAVNLDPTMELGDFRIEWKNGFAQRDVKKIWKSVEEICGRHSSLEENEENE